MNMHRAIYTYTHLAMVVICVFHVAKNKQELLFFSGYILVSPEFVIVRHALTVFFPFGYIGFE